MYTILTKSKHTSCRHVFIATLFVAFHYYLITYVNSSLLLTIISDFWVGILYAVSSIISIAALLILPFIIEKYGIYKTLFTASIIDIVSLFVIAQNFGDTVTLIAFTICLALPPILISCLDTAIEDVTPVGILGKIRGVFLTILAGASVVSPLVIGGIVISSGFRTIYILSLFFVVLFALSLWIHRDKFGQGTFKTRGELPTLREFFDEPDIRRIGVANFGLNFFYSWMIIYIPIYLSKIVGFDWEYIGIIISITLIPFVILQIPAGELADQSMGEKEMLVGGFIAMIVGVYMFSMLTTTSIVTWTLTILLARTGASIAGTMIESYFFKKSQGRDELIPVFRMAQPLAYIIGPITGSITLLLVPMRYMFPILSITLALILVPILKIKDTK